jgi:cell division protein FtsX
MDAILLTWRWQNFASISVMVITLFLLVTVFKQVMMRYDGEKAAADG